MKRKDIKKGMLVWVRDDSYSIIVNECGANHLSEYCGYLQNRNPWEVVEFKVGLQAVPSFRGKRKFNNVVIRSDSEVAFTRIGFLNPPIFDTIEEVEDEKEV